MLILDNPMRVIDRPPIAVIRYVTLAALFVMLCGGCASSRLDWRPLRIVLSDRVSGWHVDLGTNDSRESPDADLRWRLSSPVLGRGERCLGVTISNLGDERRCITLGCEYRLEGTTFKPYFAGVHA